MASDQGRVRRPVAAEDRAVQAGRRGSRRRGARRRSQETLKKGEDVAFTGFGKFRAQHRTARTGVNPRTGEKVKIPAATVPKFSAGSSSRPPSSERLARPSALSRASEGRLRGDHAVRMRDARVPSERTFSRARAVQLALDAPTGWSSCVEERGDAAARARGGGALFALAQRAGRRSRGALLDDVVADDARLALRPAARSRSRAGAAGAHAARGGDVRRRRPRDDRSRRARAHRRDRRGARSRPASRSATFERLVDPGVPLPAGHHAR